MISVKDFQDMRTLMPDQLDANESLVRSISAHWNAARAPLNRFIDRMEWKTPPVNLLHGWTIRRSLGHAMTVFADSGLVELTEDDRTAMINAWASINDCWYNTEWLADRSSDEQEVFTHLSVVSILTWLTHRLSGSPIHRHVPLADYVRWWEDQDAVVEALQRGAILNTDPSAFHLYIQADVLTVLLYIQRRKEQLEAVVEEPVLTEEEVVEKIHDYFMGMSKDYRQAWTFLETHYVVTWPVRGEDEDQHVYRNAVEAHLREVSDELLQRDSENTRPMPLFLCKYEMDKLATQGLYYELAAVHPFFRGRSFGEVREIVRHVFNNTNPLRFYDIERYVVPLQLHLSEALSISADSIHKVISKISNHLDTYPMVRTRYPVTGEGDVDIMEDKESRRKNLRYIVLRRFLSTFPKFA